MLLCHKILYFDVNYLEKKNVFLVLFLKIISIIIKENFQLRENKEKLLKCIFLVKRIIDLINKSINESLKGNARRIFVLKKFWIIFLNPK